MSSSTDKFFKHSRRWEKELLKLRSIILKTKLEESIKWNLPCYSLNGKNVAIIQPFKSFLGLMFFKGALLKDTKKILILNGPNSHSPRRLEFRSVEEVNKLKSAIFAYLKEAMAIEDSGEKLEIKRKPQALPPELKSVFAKKPNVKKAFSALTPGRQRAYLLHFAGAKQSATRQSRIEKQIPRILAGKGMHD